MSEHVTTESPQKVALDNTTTAVARAGASPRRQSRFSPSLLWQTVGPFAIFLALFAVVAGLNPGFLGGGGLVILTTQAAPILLVALGQAIVLHVGSLDLSNAAIALLSAVLSALL